jgi:hypothetical protein
LDTTPTSQPKNRDEQETTASADHRTEQNSNIIKPQTGSSTEQHHWVPPPPTAKKGSSTEGQTKLQRLKVIPALKTEQLLSQAVN